MILAIDPGTEESGVVMMREDMSLEMAAIRPNEWVVNWLDGYGCGEYPKANKCKRLAIEMVASYGMAVGRSVFETCVWIGRFIEAWGCEWRFVYRREVKMLLCNAMSAKDANIRQALIDKYEPSGGGKVPQIGTKAQPGPLYGVKSHAWAALGVAHVAAQ